MRIPPLIRHEPCKSWLCRPLLILMCFDSGGGKWWVRQGSNLRPIGYEPTALTTELRTTSKATYSGLVDF